jgi:hypothetical protein
VHFPDSRSIFSPGLRQLRGNDATTPFAISSHRLTNFHFPFASSYKHRVTLLHLCALPSTYAQNVHENSLQEYKASRSCPYFSSSRLQMLTKIENAVVSTLETATTMAATTTTASTKYPWFPLNYSILFLVVDIEYFRNLVPLLKGWHQISSILKPLRVIISM